MQPCQAIVVNWNGGPPAVECVRSLAQQSARPELWVVDNGSQDGSATSIQEACPRVRLIRNPVNLGFAAANNQVLRRLDGTGSILLMNNDARLPDRGALADVLEHLERHPAVDGICGRYEYPNGDFQRFYNRLPTPFNLIVSYGAGRFCRAWRESRATRDFLMLDDDFSRPMVMEQPAFACVLMRGESVRTVGLLDEQFPLFFNDVDYCWRWRERGYGWHYRPEWRVIHDRSRSTQRLGGLLAGELAASAVRFARKSFRLPARLMVGVAIALDRAWIRWREGDRTASVAQVWRGEPLFRAGYERT